MGLLSTKKLYELRRELYFIKKRTEKAQSQEDLSALSRRVNIINECLLAHWIQLKNETNKLLNIREN